MDTLLIIGTLLLVVCLGMIVNFFLFKRNKMEKLLNNPDLNYLLGVVAIGIGIFLYRWFEE